MTKEDVSRSNSEELSVNIETDENQKKEDMRETGFKERDYVAEGFKVRVPNQIDFNLLDDDPYHKYGIDDGIKGDSRNGLNNDTKGENVYLETPEDEPIEEPKKKLKKGSESKKFKRTKTEMLVED